ncbi:hypothetical protein HOT99_gp168 [Caulobacter phage CcrBL10]|uniref:Uncharacterized protein n=1 Tax=Caulobacter phage CcrBL10 TaxID=2283269 RepID=A0A385ECM4_9CAUD|nr:hypothetical protein HOT99_gp168 [Caulobacter phage CcrBL10]AXQ68449.1 hypothetical protein CcrBL10_gp245 [Caulobacter phage CcrBL10]
MPLYDFPTGPTTMEDIEAFVAGAQAVVNAQMAKAFPNVSPPVLTIEPIRPNTQFAKIVSSDRSQRSVWAFVRLEDGLIYKPSSWKVPAKHARGTIHTASFGAEYVDWTGPRYIKDLRP